MKTKINLLFKDKEIDRYFIEGSFEGEMWIDWEAKAYPGSEGNYKFIVHVYYAKWIIDSVPMKLINDLKENRKEIIVQQLKEEFERLGIH